MKLRFKCQCSFKKGSLFSSQKVSVFPEIGVCFLTEISEKGGSFYTRRTLMGYPLFTRVEGLGVTPTLFPLLYVTGQRCQGGFLGPNWCVEISGRQ